MFQPSAETVSGVNAAEKWQRWGNEPLCTPQEMLFLALRQHIIFHYVHICVYLIYLYGRRSEISNDPVCVDQILFKKRRTFCNVGLFFTVALLCAVMYEIYLCNNTCKKPHC